jgi:hypothetical protein
MLRAHSNIMSGKKPIDPAIEAILEKRQSTFSPWANGTARKATQTRAMQNSE